MILKEQNNQKRTQADGMPDINHDQENIPSTNGKVCLKHLFICLFIQFLRGQNLFMIQQSHLFLQIIPVQKRASKLF